MSTYISDCITIQPTLAKPDSFIYKTKYNCRYYEHYLKEDPL